MTFTDEEFLVDTGLKMSVSKLGKDAFLKRSLQKNIVVPTVLPTALDDTANENTDNLNSNLTPEEVEIKNLIKKKPGFKHNIPVRKKATSTTEESSNRRSNGAIEKRHSLEVMDANKNLNLDQGNEEGAANGTIQRRKKSQLPRPLSCVALPVRGGSLEKTNPPSRLPVMR